MRKLLQIFLLFLSLDVFLYWGIWNTFFLQDEWILFSRTIRHINNFPLALFDFRGLHFHPLADLFWIIQYKLFSFDVSYYSLVAILLHVTAIFIIYIFFERITQNKKLSIAMAALLLVSNSTKQVVIWFAVPYTLLCSIIFILIFLLFLDNILKKNILTNKNIIFLILIFLASIGFREEGYLLTIIFPIYVFIFFGKEKFLKNVKKIILLFSVMLVFLGIRIIIELIGGLYGQAEGFEQGSRALMLFYNGLTLPPKMIIQNVIEYDLLVGLALFYTKIAFPHLLTNGLTIITSVLENVVFLIFIPFSFLVGTTFIKMSDKNKKIFIFSLIWIVIYSLLLATQTRRLWGLESRYLFFGAIGVLMMFYSISSTLFTIKHKAISLTSKTLIALSAVLFLGYSFVYIKNDIKKRFIPMAEERKSIIHQILTLYPSIPEKTVFYVTCKYEKDCISIPRVFTFQSGVGQMLLVLYGSKEKNFVPFLGGLYLWDWDAESYRQIGNSGFGYFRDLEKVKQLIREQKISPMDVIALSYDHSMNKIYDISGETRKNLSKVLELAR